MEFNHKSVLLNETIDSLNIKSDGIYVDGTTGGAGHSTEIAKRLVTGRLIALDKDPDAIITATERLKDYNATVVNSDFRNIDVVLDELQIEKVDGILLDLGVSSYQLDTAERGFSYHADAALDMRMSKHGMTAADIVNNYSATELANIFRDYGDEKFAMRIAENIVRLRQDEPIKTTSKLAEIISNSVPAAARRDGHPARKVFQALRIAVNDEMGSLKEVLNKAFGRLNKGGVLAIITFHSLEDRIVKLKYREFCSGCTCPPDFPICVCGKTPDGKLVNRKPISATEEELTANPRSRSARLRAIEKIK